MFPLHLCSERRTHSEFIARNYNGYLKDWKISPNISIPRLDSAREGSRAHVHLTTHWHSGNSELLTYVFAGGLTIFSSHRYRLCPCSPCHQTELPLHRVHFYRRLPNNPGLLRNSASGILDFSSMRMPCNPQTQNFGLV